MTTIQCSSGGRVSGGVPRKTIQNSDTQPLMVTALPDATHGLALPM